MDATMYLIDQLNAEGCVYRLARVEWRGRAATLTHSARQYVTLTLSDDVAVTIDRAGRTDIENFGNFRFEKQHHYGLW